MIEIRANETKRKKKKRKKTWTCLAVGVVGHRHLFWDQFFSLV